MCRGFQDGLPLRAGKRVSGRGRRSSCHCRQASLLVGTTKAADRWKVKKALYGLQTSPRDWQQHRDKELRTIRLASPEGAKLHQGVTDESLASSSLRVGTPWG